MNAQHFTGTNTTTSDIFRSGRTAFGYTAMPTTLSNYNLLINNRTFFNERVRFKNFVHINDNLSTLNTINTNTWHTKIMLGDYFPQGDGLDARQYIKSEGGISIRPKTDWIHGANIRITRVSKTTAEGGAGESEVRLAVASCNGCYSNNSIEGDLVLSAHSSGYANGLGKNLIITNEGNGGIKFSTRNHTGNWETGWNEIRMSILKDGKIGIGTETPTELLAVNGNIHAKEVRVDLVGWPDYVFEKDYQLPTIEEVETHIIEKGHLPNVPSAAEIETNGLKLAEMSKLQMEKIEELTLYIIELKKTIEKQESRLQALENKN